MGAGSVIACVGRVPRWGISAYVSARRQLAWGASAPRPQEAEWGLRVALQVRNQLLRALRMGEAHERQTRRLMPQLDCYRDWHQPEAITDRAPALRNSLQCCACHALRCASRTS